MPDWKSEYRRNVNEYSGEVRWTLGRAFTRLILPLVALGIAMSIIGYGLGWFGEAAKVAQDQFGPQAMLAKYEWFKDASAQLDKKQADITVYEGRIKGMDATYQKLPRQKWPREDREQYNVWSSEVAGVKASFNLLAADYNAQMAKFNYRFANVGDLPKGAGKPLPREYRSYVAE
jgi:hypothetical protein